jgi:hypothetical protein
MCLYFVDSTDSTNPERLFKGRQTITCYKVLETALTPASLRFIWQSNTYPSEYPFIGVKKSNRISKELNDDEKVVGIVNRGIHVYIDFENAKSSLDLQYYPNEFVIPVICQKEDFVACDLGRNEAVFTKVRIHKRAHSFKGVKLS